MKKFPPLLLLLCLFFTACSGPASDPPLSGPSASESLRPVPDVAPMVARLVTLDGAKDLTADMRMTAENESGKREQVDFRLQRKNAEGRAMTFLTVLSPKEDADKAILAIEPADGPTEAYSYLAGLRKLARMNSDRQLGFRGAKVTIQELLAMQLGQYDFEPGQRASLAGESLLKVEFKQKPFRNLAFPRIVGFFREADGQPARFELFNSRDEILKQVTVTEVKAIQNHQMITNVSIEDLQQKLKLRLETRKIEFDTGLSDDLFTQDRLKSHITSAGTKLIQ
jgi:outer membrane lipoprotein-sorting protein